MEKPAYQQRVIDEKIELDDKRAKLQAFLGSDKLAALPEAEQFRLKMQCTVMCMYSDILAARIAAF